MMTPAVIRSFELGDWRLLHRHRGDGVFMDMASALVWGKALVPLRAVFSPFSEAVGVYTEIWEGEDSALVGQVSHTLGAAAARFTYLTPDEKTVGAGTAALVEHLVKRLGEDRKAHMLVANVDEETNTFEALRKLNFSIYARQRIWRIKAMARRGQAKGGWREMASIDEINAHKLYAAIVPKLIQQVESITWEGQRGWVFYERDEMVGYADVIEGPRGVWVQPFIHPEMEGVGKNLRALVAELKPKERRPVYVCLRTYQAGMADRLEAMGGEVGPSQAVMVRRLTAPVKKPALAPLPAINGNTEPTTPYSNTSSSTQKNG